MKANYTVGAGILCVPNSNFSEEQKGNKKADFYSIKICLFVNL